MAGKKSKGDVAKRVCVTPVFRASFCNVFKPRAMEEGGEEKYSITMLFYPEFCKFGRKKDGKRILNPLEKAAKQAAIDEWGSDQADWPKNRRNPFRQGDEKPDYEGYEGAIFVTASCKDQPGLVGPSLQPILDPKKFVSGHWARAELIAFAYDNKGNKGVSFTLRNIQKMPCPEGQDDSPFGGGRDASAVFDAVEDAEGDDESGDEGEPDDSDED